MRNRLLEYRKIKGLTQIELSAIAGVPQSAISEIETEERIPKIDTAQKIAAALGVSIEEIWPTEKVA